MALRGPTIDHSPWSRKALPGEVWAGIGMRAVQLRCHMNVVGRSERGPWTVRVWNGSRVVEHRGWDLEALCFEALERFTAGADTQAAVWRAGSDGLAHGHIKGRAVWSLCKRPAVPEAFSHPENSRCSACLRALDTDPRTAALAS